MLTLLSLLHSEPVWTGPELAARLGVTTRSIRRDVDRLRDLGYPEVIGPPELRNALRQIGQRMVAAADA